ncbi:hypothetical protein L1887_48810 [Cichorium endivia]|nr:hypothetical protein L1887_48810 [Cichorium endivia]
MHDEAKSQAAARICTSTCELHSRNRLMGKNPFAAAAAAAAARALSKNCSAAASLSDEKGRCYKHLGEGASRLSHRCSFPDQMPSTLPKAHVQPSHSATPIARGTMVDEVSRYNGLRCNLGNPSLAATARGRRGRRNGAVSVDLCEPGPVDAVGWKFDWACRRASPRLALSPNQARREAAETGGVLVVIPRPEHLRTRTRTRRRSFGPLALTQPFPLSQRQNDEAPTLQLSYEVANSLGLVRALPCINICDRVSPELPKLHPPVAAPHRSAVLLCSDSCYPRWTIDMDPSQCFPRAAWPCLALSVPIPAASPRLCVCVCVSLLSLPDPDPPPADAVLTVRQSLPPRPNLNPSSIHPSFTLHRPPPPRRLDLLRLDPYTHHLDHPRQQQVNPSNLGGECTSLTYIHPVSSFCRAWAQ